MKNEQYLSEIENVGFTHGFAFGKHTVQLPLNEKLTDVLDNNREAIIAYMKGYNEGFNCGCAESPRGIDFDEFSDELSKYFEGDDGKK